MKSSDGSDILESWFSFIQHLDVANEEVSGLIIHRKDDSFEHVLGFGISSVDQVNIHRYMIFCNEHNISELIKSKDLFGPKAHLMLKLDSHGHSVQNKLRRLMNLLKDTNEAVYSVSFHLSSFNQALLQQLCSFNGINMMIEIPSFDNDQIALDAAFELLNNCEGRLLYLSLSLQQLEDSVKQLIEVSVGKNHLCHLMIELKSGGEWKPWMAKFKAASAALVAKHEEGAELKAMKALAIHSVGGDSYGGFIRGDIISRWAEIFGVGPRRLESLENFLRTNGDTLAQIELNFTGEWNDNYKEEFEDFLDCVKRNVRHPVHIEINAVLADKLGRDMFAQLGSTKQMLELINKGKSALLGRVKICILGSRDRDTDEIGALLGVEFSEGVQEVNVGDLSSTDWNIVDINQDESLYSRELKSMAGNKLICTRVNATGLGGEALDTDCFDFNSSSVWTDVEEEEEESLPFKFKGGTTILFRRNFPGRKHIPKQDLPPILEEYKHSHSGFKISFWDFRGNEAFKATHHIFLSQSALVLILFDLVRLAEGDEEELNKFTVWLSSVALYTPKARVLFVATFLEEPTTALQSAANRMINDILDKYSEIDVLLNPQDQLWYFLLSPKLEDSVFQIRTGILATLKDSAKEVPWKREVPLAWIYFAYLMQNKFGNSASLSELESFALRKGFKESKVVDVLEFLSESGALLNFSSFFHEGRNVCDKVVFESSWLLESLSTFLAPKEGLQKFRLERGWRSLVKLYFEQGILGETLMNKILRSNKVTKKDISVIKDISSKMLIMSRLHALPLKLGDFQRKYRKNNRFWLVPRMNKPQTMVDDTGLITFASVKWDEFVSETSFVKFVTLCLRQSLGKRGACLVSFSSESAAISIQEDKLVFILKDKKTFTVKVNEDCSKRHKSSVLDILKTAKSVFNKNNFVIDAGINIVVEVCSEIETVDIEFSYGKCFDVFLSYSWGEFPSQSTKKIVQLLVQKLSAVGFSVLFDNGKATETELLTHVPHCVCFIGLVTSDYLEKSADSDHQVFKEIQAASELSIEDQLFLILEKAQLNRGKGTKVAQIDFTSPRRMTANFDELCDWIRSRKSRSG